MSRLHTNAPIIKVEPVEVLEGPEEDVSKIPVPAAEEECDLSSQGHPSQGHPQYSPISTADPNILQQSSTFVRQNYAAASPGRQQTQPTYLGVGQSIIAKPLPRILKECTGCKFKTDMTKELCFNVIQMKAMSRNDLQAEPKASQDGWGLTEEWIKRIYGEHPMLYGATFEKCRSCQSFQIHYLFSRDGAPSLRLNLGGCSPVIINNSIRICQSKEEMQCKLVVIGARPRASPAYAVTFKEDSNSYNNKEQANPTTSSSEDYQAPPSTLSHLWSKPPSVFRIASPREQVDAMKTSLFVPKQNLEQSFSSQKQISPRETGTPEPHGVVHSPMEINRHSTSSDPRVLIRHSPFGVNHSPLRPTPDSTITYGSHDIKTLPTYGNAQSLPQSSRFSPRNPANGNVKVIAEGTVQMTNPMPIVVQVASPREQIRQNSPSVTFSQGPESKRRRLSSSSSQGSNKLAASQGIGTGSPGTVPSPRSEPVSSKRIRDNSFAEEVLSSSYGEANSAPSSAEKGAGCNPNSQAGLFRNVITQGPMIVGISSIVTSRSVGFNNDRNNQEDNRNNNDAGSHVIAKDKRDNSSRTNESNLIPRMIIDDDDDDDSDSVATEMFDPRLINDKKLSKWSNADVVAFLKETDCKGHSSVFEREEIDGKALLLLNEEKLNKLLGIKIGPAMKLVRHIRNLKNCLAQEGKASS